MTNWAKLSGCLILHGTNDYVTDCGLTYLGGKTYVNIEKIKVDSMNKNQDFWQLLAAINTVNFVNVHAKHL